MKASLSVLRVLSVFVSILVLLMPVSFAQQFSQADVKAVGVNDDFLAELRESESVSLELWRLDSASVVFKTSSGVEWEFVPLSRDGPALYMVGPVESAVNLARVDELSGGVGALVDKPDLVTGEFIDVFPKNPTTEQLIEFIYTTLNSGDGEASPSVTKFYVDGDEKISCNVPSLKKNNYLQCGVKVSGIVIGAGSHVLKEVVDANSQVSESDEGNNVLFQNLVVRKPEFDLIVTDLYTTPSIPDDASTFTIVVKVKNVGKHDLKVPFSGAFYFDGVKWPFTPDFNEGAIAGKEYQSDLGGNSFKAGLHTIKFVVDDEGKISETNEGNNAKQISVDVKHVAKYDLAVSQIYTVPASVNDASAFDLKWVVENKGDSIDASLFADSKIDGGSFLRFCDFSPLDEGEGAWLYSGKSYTCTGNVKLAAGSYTATADVELIGPVDADPSNNQQSWSFTVSSSKPVYDCNGVKKSCKDADAVGVCVGAVLKCCMKDYPHYWNLDDTCHASVEPVKCALPDGSGAGCDCDWSKDCPSSHPFCEQSYPAPISDGFDGCLAVVPEYCGNGVCAEGESFGTCEVDCAAPLGFITANVYHATTLEPIPGVGVSVDGVEKGMTDGNGKVSFPASQGVRYFKAECPDSSFCSEQSVKVSSNSFVAFKCDCDESVDTDGDGSSDADEKLLGTNPKDASSSYMSAFFSFDYPKSCSDIPGLAKVVWDNRDDLLQGDVLVVNALNNTKVLSASLESEPVVVVSALKAASLNGRIEAKSVPTLMQGLESSESLGYLETGSGVLLTFTDYDTSSTAVIIIGAVCVGEFIGVLYGAGSGVKDDVVGVWELIEGIWHVGSHPFRAVTETISFLKEMKLAHFWSGAGMAFMSMLRGILEKGRGVNLFRHDRFDNPEAYHTFQLGFFTGFIEGYIAEQVLAALTGVGAILKFLKSGVLLGKTGKSLKLAATLTKITQKFSGEVAGLVKDLKYAHKIADWTELEQNGIARLARLKQQKWLNELSEAEAKTAAKHADDILEAGKLTEGQMQNLLTTHLGRETIKLSETTPELLAKQSKLVEKLGAEEINKITKKSFFKAFDAERVDGLNKIIDVAPEGLINQLTIEKITKLIGDADSLKALNILTKFCKATGIAEVTATAPIQTCIDIFMAFNKIEDIEDVMKGVKLVGKYVNDISKISLKSEELTKVWQDLGKISDVKGIQKLTKNIADDITLNNAEGGFTFEAELAANLKRAGKPLEEVSKEITTQFGKTEIDSLLKKGDIYEAKKYDWDVRPPGSDKYLETKQLLGEQIKNFQEFQKVNGFKDSTITIVFKGSVEAGIEKWLKETKGVLVEVIP